MFIRWLQTLTALFLLLSPLFNVLAQRPPKPSKVPGPEIYPIRIVQDQRAKDAGFTVWSIAIRYDQDTSTLFSDPQLMGLAKQAYDEMAADWIVQKTDKSKRPFVMSALAIGKTIYFSSSQKGKSFVYEFAQGLPINAAIERCFTGLEGTEPGHKPQHKNRAGCGEVMAQHQFLRDPRPPVSTPFVNRVATYGRLGNGDPQTLPLTPCGGYGKDDTDHTTWGCKQFMISQEVTALDRNVRAEYKQPPYMYADRLQVSLCPPPLK